MAQILNFKRPALIEEPAVSKATLPGGWRCPLTQEDLIERLINGVAGEKPLSLDANPSLLRTIANGNSTDQFVGQEKEKSRAPLPKSEPREGLNLRNLSLVPPATFAKKT